MGSNIARFLISLFSSARVRTCWTPILQFTPPSPGISVNVGSVSCKEKSDGSLSTEHRHEAYDILRLRIAVAFWGVPSSLKSELASYREYRVRGFRSTAVNRAERSRIYKNISAPANPSPAIAEPRPVCVPRAAPL